MQLEIDQRHRNSDSSLQASREAYQAIFEGSVEGYLLLDETIRDCNANTAQLLGVAKEEVIGRPLLDFAPDVQPDGRSSVDVLGAKQKEAASGESSFFYWQFQSPDGEKLDTEVWLKKLGDGSGGSQMLMGVRDVTESLRLSAELARSQAEYRKLYDNARRDEQLIRSLLAASADPIMIFDASSRCRFVNDSFTDIFGWTAPELADDTGVFIPENAVDSDRWLWKELRAFRPVAGLETVRLTKDGREIPVSVSAAAVVNQSKRQPADALFILRDVTSQHEASQALRRAYEIQKELAERDPLTGLFNHRRIHDELDKEIVRSRRSGSFFSILLIDLDHFKTINDRHGHLFGDEALRLLSDVLQQNTRASDVVGRYGGDEFMVILPGADFRGAGLLSRRVAEELKATPLKAPNGEAVLVRASMGVATFPFDSAGKAELINMADQAMYSSKAAEGEYNISFGPSRVSTADWSDDPDKVLKLVDVLDGRDQYSRTYIDRVARTAARLGSALGMGEERLANLDLAARLHDLGNIYVSEEIRFKSAPLSREEEEAVRQHPLYLHKLLQEVESLSEDILEAVKHHHEHWDGSGFPDEQAGEDIPLLARILNLASTAAALEMERDFGRGASALDSIQAELERRSGIQLDPHLVETYLAEA